MERDQIATVRQIMLEFAEETGIRGGAAARRYLWTDAFAVCNYLELYRQTGEESWRELATLLVDQVHQVLGRHRPGGSRSGWISGLSDEEGERHPTRGGLRIGKLLDERAPREPPDERLEWERDGQYLHYLTKWMHALNAMGRVTGDGRYLLWGMELAQAMHKGFSHSASWGGKQLYWKMSIDLSRPLVPSMGLHDPLDALVTCCELQSAAKRGGEKTTLTSPPLPRDAAPRTPPSFPGEGQGGDGVPRTGDGVPAAVPDLFPDLTSAIEDLSGIGRGMGWETDDLLGIGGLLCDAWRIAQLMQRGDFPGHELLEKVLRAALRGIGQTRGMLDLPDSYRLPFRELGFSIGVHAAKRLAAGMEGGEVVQRDMARLANYHFLAGKVEDHWLGELSKKAETWREHRDINMVMLATSLAPEEFLRV